MGIIQKQSISNSIINFIGALVGAVNMVIIYEILLEPAQLGKIKYLISTAFLLVPFVMLGVSTTMLRFYPRFESKERKNHGILGFGLLYTSAGIVIYFLITQVLFDQLPAKFKDNYAVISGLLVFAALSTVFTTYLASLKKIVVPALFNNLWIKIGVPILVVLFFKGVISFEFLEWNLILVYGIASLGLVIYIRYLNALFIKPNFKILTPELRSEIGSYAIYSTLGPMGAVLMTHLDQFMVTEILEYQENGIYTMAIYFGSLFTIPMASIFSIANPIISDSSDKGDRENIFKIYRKSSINLLAVGVLGLILIWASIDDVFGLMSKGDIYSQGKYVVLLLALAKIIDMATSVNGAIIAHSRYFRFNLYAILVLGIANIFANYFFINSMGINGAALATLTALGLFNVVKFIYVWKKFDMQPFTLNSLILLLLGAGVFVLGLFLDFSSIHPFLAIMARTIILGLIFTALIYYFKISTDINQIIDRTIKKIFK